MAGQPEAGSTRGRIQAIAFELFSKQGYEKTSLREIAERLNVTKAALYYHFRTKEDIVHSMVDSYLTTIDELVEWAHAQPQTLDTRQEVIRRYATLLWESRESTRFFQQNPALQHEEIGEKFRARMRGLHEILRDRDAPVADQIRSMLALLGLTVTTFTLNDPESAGEWDENEAKAAAVDVAMDLLSPR